MHLAISHLTERCKQSIRTQRLCSKIQRNFKVRTNSSKTKEWKYPFFIVLWCLLLKCISLTTSAIPKRFIKSFLYDCEFLRCLSTTVETSGLVASLVTHQGLHSLCSNVSQSLPSLLAVSSISIHTINENYQLRSVWQRGGANANGSD